MGRLKKSFLFRVLCVYTVLVRTSSRIMCDNNGRPHRGSVRHRVRGVYNSDRGDGHDFLFIYLHTWVV